MVSPASNPKHDRNRFSFILRFGSSRRSRYPSSPPNTAPTDGIASSSTPSRPFMSLLPPTPTLPDTDNSPSNSAAVVPPTSNELCASEKARLLKKARKLSQVFGEMPIFEHPDLPLGDGSNSAFLFETEQVPTKGPSSPLPLSRVDSLKRRTLLRLSSQLDMMNQSLPADELQIEVPHHSRPSSPPRPGFSLDVNRDSIMHEGRPHSLDYSVVDSSEDDDKYSITSVSTITCPEQQQISLAELTRHLNENGSPELVSRFGDDMFQKMAKEKRRDSLDLALLPLPLFTSGGPLGPSEEGTGLQRFGVQAYMDEQERLLNVKRARKMTRLFGHDPPLELFHVTQAVLPSTKQSASTLNPFPTSPTPSANTWAGDDTMPAPHDVKSSSFQERRRRAAKLSQFFGVAYQDITSMLAVPEQTVITAKPTYRYLEEECPVQVDIKISGRSRLWGGRNDLREADIVDARDKLRGLKAA